MGRKKNPTIDELIQAFGEKGVDPAKLLPDGARKGKGKRARAVRKGKAVLDPGNPLEDDEQIELASYLDSRADMVEKWAHIANERRASQARHAKLARMGVKKGLPDVMIFRHFELGGRIYFGLAIELKRRRAVPSDLKKMQKVRLLTLREEGWYSCVCKGSCEATAIVEMCFGEDSGGSGGGRTTELRGAEGSHTTGALPLWAHEILGSR